MSSDNFRFKIAIATNSGERIDGHFGSCETFAIYQFDADTIEHLETRAAIEVEGVEKNGVRAEQISDCHLIYVASIGGPAAAKVIKFGLYPLKTKEPITITDALQRLQQVIEGNPPPWMAKLMGNNEPLSHILETSES
tara:strand:+ start:13201 stop:13614 length:414 start_codon:yes stop_codon:yes gene_type:complete